MNLPGTEEGNWAWRYSPEQLTAALAQRLRELTGSTNRDARSELRCRGRVSNPQVPTRDGRF